ncbi:MAG TPA: aspartyl protease family protein [Steroidobacteraceae bacterium]|jgi:predicted aspartyl protease|nr:aspartyl protease family protein [Steroidobacteraceae bacterium]
MKGALIAFSGMLFSNCFAAVVVPIEIEQGNPVASARINGVAVRLIIDSGGGVITLKSDTIKRVSAPRTGSTRATTDALGNNAARNLFHLNTLEVGDLRFADVQADEATEYASKSPVDGVIGRFLLSKFVVVYDYSSGKITVIESNDRAGVNAACQGSKIDLVPASEELVVSRARIDDREIRVLWDTGAVYSFIKKSFVDKNELPVEEPYYTSQHFAFGEHDFGPFQFVVLDLRAPVDVDAYVGSNFFLDHVVCIDPTHRVVRVRKSPPS